MSTSYFLTLLGFFVKVYANRYVMFEVRCMGIDTNAVIVVGLPRGELNHIDDLEKLVDEEVLEIVSAWYDGEGADEAVAGIIFKSSPTYDATEIRWDENKILKLKEEFKRATGKEAKVLLMPQAW